MTPRAKELTKIIAALLDLRTHVREAHGMAEAIGDDLPGNVYTHQLAVIVTDINARLAGYRNELRAENKRAP